MPKNLLTAEHTFWPIVGQVYFDKLHAPFVFYLLGKLKLRCLQRILNANALYTPPKTEEFSSPAPTLDAYMTLLQFLFCSPASTPNPDTYPPPPSLNFHHHKNFHLIAAGGGSRERKERQRGKKHFAIVVVAFCLLCFDCARGVGRGWAGGVVGGLLRPQLGNGNRIEIGESSGENG